MATLPGERIQSAIPKSAREQLPVEQVTKIRDFVLKARNGEGPKLNREQIDEIQRLISRGVVKEDDVLPPLGTLEAGVEAVKTAAGGTLETVGGLASILPEGPFGESLVGQAGERIQEFGGDIKIDRTTLPNRQANLLAATDLAASSRVPANIIVTAGKIRASSLTPEQVQSLGTFSSMLVDASRNPRKFKAIESALGAVSGIGGEQAAKLSGEESRIVGELFTNFGAVISGRILKSVSNIFKLKAGSTKEAEEAVGQFLKSEFDRDPRIEARLTETEEIEKATGARFTLEKATQDPVIAATAKTLGTRGEDALKMDADTTVAIERFAREINPKENTLTGKRTPGEIVDFQDKVIKEVDAMETKFENDIDGILDEMSEAILGTDNNESIQDIADTARGLLDRSKASLSNAISRGYSKLGDLRVDPQDVRGLFVAMNRASLTQAKGTPIPTSVSNIIDRLKKSFKINRLEDRPIFKGAASTEKVKADLRESRLLVLNEVDSDVSQAMRDAGKAGARDEVRRLRIIKSGVNSVYDALSKKTDLGAETISTLKQLKKMRVTMGSLFENAEIELAFKKQKQGDFKTAPEDLMDLFIRTGKKAFRSADYYSDIFQGSKESQNLMRLEFSRRLRAFASDPNKEGQLIPSKIAQFQKKYSSAIEAYGYEEDFKNFNKIKNFAEESVAEIGESRSKLGRTAFKAFAETSTPEAFVDKLIKNPEILRRFARDMDKRSMSFVGFRDLVVDRIIEGSQKGIAFGETLVGAETKFDLNFFESVLADPKGILEDVIGSGHLKALKTLAVALGRKEIVGSVGVKATELAKEIPGVAVRQILASTRAALRGFVRADFILFQAGFRGAEALASKKRVEVLKLAMKDIQFARDLVLMARNKPLLGTLKSMFSPSIAAKLKAPENESNITGNLARETFQGFKGLAEDAALGATNAAAEALEGLGR